MKTTRRMYIIAGKLEDDVDGSWQCRTKPKSSRTISRCGADTDARDAEGNTAQRLAGKHAGVATLLAKAGLK